MNILGRAGRQYMELKFVNVCECSWTIMHRRCECCGQAVYVVKTCEQVEHRFIYMHVCEKIAAINRLQE